MCDKFWICNMSAGRYLVQPFYMDDGGVPDNQRPLPLRASPANSAAIAAAIPLPLTLRSRPRWRRQVLRQASVTRSMTGFPADGR